MSRRGEGRPTPAVIGVVGRSGAGKTSLLERLIAALAARGLAVGAAKHASHGFLADRPGKDSHRLYESGAEAVALISREQLATFRRLEEQPRGEVSLQATLRALPERLDVVLVEGFSWEPIPRIVVVGAREAPGRDQLAAGEVIAIVEGTTRPGGAKPEFPDSLIEALARAVAARVPEARGRRHPPGSAGPSLVPLDPAGP